jgi:hypothetical protein
MLTFIKSHGHRVFLVVMLGGFALALFHAWNGGSAYTESGIIDMQSVIDTAKPKAGDLVQTESSHY